MLVINFSFRLIVRGKGLEYKDSCKCILLCGFERKYIRKGTVLSESMDMITPKDIISIKKTYDCFEQGIQDFSVFLKKNKRIIDELKKDCEVSAVCFINADYADFSYSIPVDIMKTFIDMDIPLQFDVLSWGLVEGGETKYDSEHR